MEDLTLEIIETFPVGKVTFGCEAKSGNQISAMRSAAVLGLNSPFHGLVVELCINYSAIKCDILPNV